MESTLGVLITLSISLLLNTCAYSKRPAVVNVGALFSFDSVIGKAAKAAMEIAVIDVNKDSRILNGTEMKLFMEDTNCSVFKGSIGGISLSTPFCVRFIRLQIKLFSGI